MKPIRLSRRLRAIEKLIPAGAAVADIGCDHAWLDIELILSEKARTVIATDLRQRPLTAAEEHAKSRGVYERIDFRCGNGLSVLQEDEADVIVIAGMGGCRMIDMLSRFPSPTKGAMKLILSPNREAASLRRWTYENGFTLVDEKVVKERRQFYEILVLSPTPSPPLSDVELYFGPVLLRRFDEITEEYYAYQTARKDRILNDRRKIKNPSREVIEEAGTWERLWKSREEVRCQFN